MQTRFKPCFDSGPYRSSRVQAEIVLVCYCRNYLEQIFPLLLAFAVVRFQSIWHSKHCGCLYSLLLICLYRASICLFDFICICYIWRKTLFQTCKAVRCSFLLLKLNIVLNFGFDYYYIVLSYKFWLSRSILWLISKLRTVKQKKNTHTKRYNWWMPTEANDAKISSVAEKCNVAKINNNTKNIHTQTDKHKHKHWIRPRGKIISK